MNTQTQTSQIKQEFLDRYSFAIAQFQPLIEARVSELARESITLGNIKLKNIKSLGKDLTEYALKQAISEVVKEKGSINRLEQTLLKFVFHWPFRFLPGGFESLRKREEHQQLVYFNQAIYVPKKTRRTNLDTIESDIVHELSHCLWENLGGKNLFDLNLRKKPRFYIYYEGFAFYSERVWFKDFYSEEYIQKLQELGEPVDYRYTEGKNKIEELVSKHGQKILLEIPKNWEEKDFENGF